MAKCPLWLQYHFINRVLYIFWNSSLPPDQQKDKDKSLQILNTCYFFDCSESRKFKDIKYDKPEHVFLRKSLLCVLIFFQSANPSIFHTFSCPNISIYGMASLHSSVLAPWEWLLWIWEGSWENPVSASNIITFHALFRADGWSNKTPTGSVTNLVLPSLEVIIGENKNSCKLLLPVFLIYYKL